MNKVIERKRPHFIISLKSSHKISRLCINTTVLAKEKEAIIAIWSIREIQLY